MGLTVSRPSNGQKLTVKRQIKKLIFYRELSNMQINIKRQKVSKYFQSHYFS